MDNCSNDIPIKPPSFQISDVLPADFTDHKQRFHKKISLPFIIGSGILLIIGFLALLGPTLTHFSPSAINVGPRLTAPNPTFWFGTDPLGRDLFTRVIYGLQVSIMVSTISILIAAVPGILLGVISGYYRGWIDQINSRLIDILMSFPSLLLAIVLIARLGPSLQTTMIALGVTGVPTLFRITRNETISASHQSYVEASISLGASPRRIILRHIIPNIASSLLVYISMRMGIFILMVSGLSFIGLGVQPPQPELGTLLAEGKEYYSFAWWMVVFPAFSILLSVLGLNLFGEGLRDILDP